ncbi:LrgB family protein [Paraglaciecola sp. L3A3]|uniref:LrgB family protein n=1 Tax=Paraglaciecola sp. L3A3 TaxID=2686358 RepID=UPI00131CE5D4|nr:LrgB family protein [Paraglaciecola sp. L3A3]
MIEIIATCGVSLLIFLGCFFLQRRYQSPLLNPLLLSVIVIISLLMSLGLSYQDYMQGAEYINYLLEPAVVLLGYPLYKQRYLLQAQWPKILCICFCASFSVLTLIPLFAQLLGLEQWLIGSMIAMNITTAVAMSTSIELGGTASISAVMVLVAGVSGSIFGVYWLRLLGFIDLKINHQEMDINHDEQQKIIGMAIGSASHALGTASLAKPFPIAAAYASTALILCAIITAVIAPIYVPFLLGY